MAKFVIRFKGNFGTLYYGKGWGPVASKASAVKFATREGAEQRLANVKEIMSLPGNEGLWYAHHMDKAEVVS